MRTDPRAAGRRAWSRFSWCAIDWRPRHPARIRHRRDGTLYAAANTAQADAVITAWDADLHYGTWRPVTAVREADTDGNPTTRADRHWEPLLVTPCPSDCLSGHTTTATPTSTSRTSSTPASLAGSTPARPTRWATPPVADSPSGRCGRASAPPPEIGHFKIGHF